MIELARNLACRITDGPPADAHPRWDPDGQHVVFNSQRFGGDGPARQALSGGKGACTVVRETRERSGPVVGTRDRQYILLHRTGATSGSDGGCLQDIAGCFTSFATPVPPQRIRTIGGPCICSIRRSMLAAVLILHNHPSGDPSPSPDDVELTRRLRAAGVLIGIEVVDHVVLGDARYCSLKEMGQL